MASEKLVAQKILENVGSKDNILSAEHCATRLRLVLKDETKFNKKEIENIDGVKGSFKAAGQYQIILGTGFVDKVYHEFMQLTGLEEASASDKINHADDNLNVFQKASRLLGDVFLPIILFLLQPACLWASAV